MNLEEGIVKGEWCDGFVFNAIFCDFICIKNLHSKIDFKNLKKNFPRFNFSRLRLP